MNPNRITERGAWRLWLALTGILTIGLIMVMVRYFEQRGEPVDHVATSIAQDSVVSNQAAIDIDSNAIEAVERFGAFIRRDEPLGRSHDFSSGALNRLADAIESLAGGTDSASLRAGCDSIRGAAARLKLDPTSTSHADELREAFITASRMMRTLRQHRMPEREGAATPVVNAATTIDPNRRLLEQESQVRAYLRRSYELLDMLARST